MLFALLQSLGLLAYVGLVVAGVVRLCRFAGGGSRLRIACARPVDEAVAALSACCMPAASRSLVSQWMTGHVSRGSVRVQRRARGRRNAFAAVFSGDFREQGGGVVLVGEFGMAALTQGFLVLWCGGVVLALLLGLRGAIVEGRRDALEIAAGAAAMLLVCGALVRLGKTWGAQDIRWMTGVMREAVA